MPSDQRKPTPVSQYRAGGWLLLTLVAYSTALWWLDRDRHVVDYLQRMTVPLLLATLPVSLSYVLRYQRWRRLLKQRSHVFPWRSGFIAYLAGFALTASPGKAGELLRIRYFGRLDVPATDTFAAFICERSLDLLVIAAIGACAASLFAFFGWAVAIVLVVLAILATLSVLDPLRAYLHRHCECLPQGRVRRTLGFAIEGTASLRLLFSLKASAEGVLLGLGAWLLTSLAFIWICEAMSLSLPWPVAIGIYPLAMLLGAISFVPGGVGTTEAAIVVMLRQCGVPMDQAIAVAIGARLVSLWFAVAVGMFSLALLETARRRERIRSAPG